MNSLIDFTDLTTWNRQVFWSIGEKVSYLTVTQKSTERYRHRPLTSRVRLEMVPAWSHKPNHVGSNPALATNWPCSSKEEQYTHNVKVGIS